jgi:hypothetical protein
MVEITRFRLKEATKKCTGTQILPYGPANTDLVFQEGDYLLESGNGDLYAIPRQKRVDGYYYICARCPLNRNGLKDKCEPVFVSPVGRKGLRVYGEMVGAQKCSLVSSEISVFDDQDVKKQDK